MTKKYKIAERVIEISSIHKYVHEYCCEYETDEPSDCSVTITPEDIEYEKLKTDAEYEYEGHTHYEFSPEELECTAVYRKIGEKMPEYDSVVYHGSVISVDGQGYLFTAKSGTGKSTHTRLWMELFGERAIMVNDDKPILRIANNCVTAYGTPYNGKHRLGSNIAVPLKAVCILTRSEDNHIERITKREAYPMLIQQTYRPKNREAMAKTLKLADKLAERVELYRLGCNMDISAAQVAYDGMKGD